MPLEDRQGKVLANYLFSLLPGDIEKAVDIGLRHRSPASMPNGYNATFDYLKHWIRIGRAFAYATQDDSWGEFEKLFAIIVRRMIVAERRVSFMREKFRELASQLDAVTDE